MFCKYCGKEIANPGNNCPFCGQPLTAAAAAAVPEAAPVQPAAEPVQAQPAAQPAQYAQPVQYAPAAPVYAPVQPAAITPDQLPEQYRPLGAWSYFGLSLLFAVPVVGFIFLIIFSFNSSNINRRSFARSFWCWLIIAAVAALIVLIIALATGGLASMSYYY